MQQLTEQKGLTEVLRLNAHVRKTMDEEDLVDMVHSDTQKVFNKVRLKSLLRELRDHGMLVVTLQLS